MEKKYWFVFAAVLLFFAGAILVTEFPVIATLIAFLEAAGGFMLGVLFKRSQDKFKLAVAEENAVALNAEIANLKDALKKFKAEKEEKSKTAKSKKNKE